jgi:hypothetical protein
LLWLKPLAARVVEDSERGLRTLIPPEVDGARTAA